MLRPDLLQFTVKEQFISAKKVNVTIFSDYFSPLNKEIEEIIFSQLSDVSDIINLTYNIYIDQEVALADISDEDKKEILTLKYLSEKFPLEFIQLRANMADFNNLQKSDLSSIAYENLSLYLEREEIIESIPIYNSKKQVEDIILINGYPFSKLVFGDFCNVRPEENLNEVKCPKYLDYSSYFLGCMYDCVPSPTLYTLITITIGACASVAAWTGPVAPVTYFTCVATGVVGVGGARAIYCTIRCAQDPLYYYRDENCPTCYTCVPGEELMNDCEGDCQLIKRCNAYGTSYDDCVYTRPCPEGWTCKSGECCESKALAEEECDLSIKIFPKNNTNSPNTIANGGLAVLVGGGQSPYTWEWSDGGGGGFNRTRLAAGTYCITVYDASENCCIAIDCATIYDDYQDPCQEGLESIVVNLESKPACDGKSGFLYSSVSGGNPPYSYAWNNGGVKSSLQNQPPGIYIVTVTDASGCTAEGYGYIGGPIDEIEPEIKLIDSKKICGANLGALSVFLYTSTPVSSYAWSNGASTPQLTNLSAGSYTVTATDECGNEYIKSFTISQTPPVSVSGQVTASCDGGNSGSIDLTINGGQKPISYVWSHGSNGGDQFGLAGGSYTVTVTDNCGQTAIRTFNVPASSIIEANISTTPSCTNNGTVKILNVTGGVPPYNYAWSVGGSSTSLSNIGPGTYCVTITDANGCSALKCAEVLSSTPLQVSVSSTNFNDCRDIGNGKVSGVAPNASATLNVVGANNFTIQWKYNGQNVGSGLSITPQYTGSYSYTVTTPDGCSASGSVDFCCCSTLSGVNGRPCYPGGGQSAPSIQFSVIPLNSVLGVQGAIKATLSQSSIASISYAWTGPNNFTSNSPQLSNLTTPGTYTLTVSDGCVEVTKSVTIADCGGSGAIISGGVVTNTCPTYEVGSINLNPSGGGSGYSFLWSNGSTTNSISELPVGTYSVTVTSGAGCSSSETFAISDIGSVVSVPNWEECRVDLECNGEVVGMGATGQSSVSLDPFNCTISNVTCTLPGFGNNTVPSTTGSYSDFRAVAASGNTCIYEGKCPLSGGSTGNTWQEIARGTVTFNSNFALCEGTEEEGDYYCIASKTCTITSITLPGGSPFVVIGNEYEFDRKTCPTLDEDGNCENVGSYWLKIGGPGGSSVECVPSMEGYCMYVLQCDCFEITNDPTDCRKCDGFVNGNVDREVLLEGVNGSVFESAILENPTNKSDILIKIVPSKYSHSFNFIVLNANGQKVWDAENIPVHNTELLKIPLGEQSSGVFFVQIYDGFHQITHKVIKLP